MLSNVCTHTHRLISLGVSAAPHRRGFVRATVRLRSWRCRGRRVTALLTKRCLLRPPVFPGHSRKKLGSPFGHFGSQTSTLFLCARVYVGSVLFSVVQSTLTQTHMPDCPLPSVPRPWGGGRGRGGKPTTFQESVNEPKSISEPYGPPKNILWSLSPFSTHLFGKGQLWV